MEDIQTGRSFLKSAETTISVANGLISYAKTLLGPKRSFWKPPQQGEFPVTPSTWLEEMILISYKIMDCAKANMKQFCSEKLQDQLVSILTFTAAELKQLDVVAPCIEQIVQCLTCPDIILPFYVYNRNLNAVSLLLGAYHEEVSDSTLLVSSLFLAKNKSTAYQAEKYIEKLAPKFPAIIPSVKAYLMVQSVSSAERQTKCEEALSIITAALESFPNNAYLLYNAAILSLKAHNKEKACSFAQKALKADPEDPSITLLVMKLLRSNCNFEAALNIADRSVVESGKWNKHIVIEAMFVAAESGDMTRMEGYFQRLRKNWKKDTCAMNCTVRLNLMLGKLQNASECFQIWAEFDQQSPDFFFCYSQLCVASQDFEEAEKNLYFAIEAESERAEFHAALAIVLFKRGKKEMALERAKFATELEPENIHAWLALATVSTGDVSSNALRVVQELRCNTIELEPLDFIIFNHYSLINNTDDM